MIQTFLFVLLIISSRVISEKSDTFNELLMLEPLPNGNIIATFQFDSDHHVNPHSQYRHFIFPKSIKKLLYKYQIQYMQLSLTQGIWDINRWGLQPNITLSKTNLKMTSNPTGASLWTCSYNLLDDVIWQEFTNVLGALLGASFNLMTPSTIAHPELEYYPDLDPKMIRHSVLPRELVCTENLTPWIKLLPCLDHAGLSLLLNPTRIYRSLYHSMNVCLYNDGEKYQMTLSLMLVLDPSLLKQSAHEWSLQSLFQPIIDSNCKCNLATTTKVLVSLDRIPVPSKNNFKLPPKPSTTIHDNRKWMSYECNNDTIFSEIKITNTQKSSILGSELRSPIHFERRIVDQGQERGLLWIRIRNTDLIHEYHLDYLDILPWQMYLYMHTWRMTITTNNHTNDSFQRHFSYSPALRQRPSVIECSWNMAPGSLIEIILAFDKEHMVLSEYPYDSSRGLDVPGALLIVSNNHSKISYTSISSPSLLLTIPLADDTMPFNVITFTCSIWAVFYGPLFNLLYKPFEAVRKDIKMK